jgi:hypothetical protein
MLTFTYPLCETQLLNFHFKKYPRNNCLESYFCGTVVNAHTQAEINLSTNSHIFLCLAARFPRAVEGN